MSREPSPARTSFRWPDGKRAAISLTFDDARVSQVDRGLPILDAHGVKATFFVSPSNLKERLAAWRKAAAAGQEIGNHSLTHPCSGNFSFAQSNPLEDYTLERMEQELVGANGEIEGLVGVRPTSFAYPCGQTFVGRGENTSSYVPLVARLFVAGRSAFDEIHNDPSFCDLAQLTGLDADCAGFDELMALVDRAAADGAWLVLFGHDVGDGGRQTVRADALDALCRHAQGRDSGLWMDTVTAIGRYVLRTRGRR